MNLPLDDRRRDAALRLRRQDHLSLKDIAQRTGIAKSTLSVLLRPYPLPARIRQAKITGGGAKGNAIRHAGPPEREYTRPVGNTIGVSLWCYQRSVAGWRPGEVSAIVDAPPPLRSRGISDCTAHTCAVRPPDA